MEGKGLVKSVILGVLLLGSLVAPLPQAQADAAGAAAGSKICCKDEDAKKCFYVCLFKGSRTRCAATCKCVLTSGTTCPGDYPSSNLLTNKEDLATEYCKLGCRSSACDNMSSNVDGTEEMRAAMERCGEACRHLCDGNAAAGTGGIASVAA